MATDPFQLLMQFANSQSQAASQERSLAQNALMSVFQEEAARQRPYATMPAELAQQKFAGDNKMQNQMTLIDAKASAKRRYGKKNKDKSNSNTDLVDNNSGAEFETVTVDGKEYQIPKN